jgi:hypothetical protein
MFPKHNITGKAKNETRKHEKNKKRWHRHRQMLHMEAHKTKGVIKTIKEIIAFSSFTP